MMKLLSCVRCLKDGNLFYENPSPDHLAYAVRFSGAGGSRPNGGQLSTGTRLEASNGRAERRSAEVYFRHVENLSRYDTRLLGLRAGTIQARKTSMRLRAAG